MDDKINGLQSCLSLGLIFFSIFASAADIDQIETNTQELIRQQDRLRQLRQQQEPVPDARGLGEQLQKQAPIANDVIPENEQPCFKITKIVLLGDAADKFQFALNTVLKNRETLTKPILGRCLGVLGINALMVRVQNAIIAKGYVTTRVLAAPQDLKSGVLQLTIVPGRVGAVRFTPDSSKRANAWNVVPISKGDILRQDIFENEADFTRLKEDITHSLLKTKCKLHAYVVMTNHFHLLLTPKDKNDLKVFMQSLSNRYVRYFNATRQRTGTIWEGRYKSCLVDSDNYLFTLYKYIEMNPIKANIVTKLEDYPWSSYHHNALGQPDKLITTHTLYNQLGDNAEEQTAAYTRLFEQLDISKQDKEITQATQKGEVFGKDNFHAQITKKVSRPTRLTAHGGDRKSEAYQEENQAG